jgi:hypothetical protein
VFRVEVDEEVGHGQRHEVAERADVLQRLVGGLRDLGRVLSPGVIDFVNIFCRKYW